MVCVSLWLPSSRYFSVLLASSLVSVVVVVVVAAAPTYLKLCHSTVDARVAAPVLWAEHQCWMGFDLCEMAPQYGYRW